MTTLVKQPSESRLYKMDFKRSLDSEDKIMSVASVVATPSTVVIGEAVSDDRHVSFRVSGGTSGESYNITVVVITSKGETIEGDGLLIVKETI
jgi:hypothetical protein